MLEIFPWHMHQWQLIVDACNSQRLPHAILFSGPKGIGQEVFARNLAQTLLCENRNDVFNACGQCRGCYLFQVGNHPDLRFICPEEEGKQIKVEQIRDLIEFINLKSQYGREKIVIIQPAEAMNRNAANTLLKTLEEPPERSVMLLCSVRTDLLPVTIRSRCNKIFFHPDYSDNTIHWLKNKVSNPDRVESLLKMAKGAPLEAIYFDQEDLISQQHALEKDLADIFNYKVDPVTIAGKWSKQGAARIFDWILNILIDLTKLKLNPSIVNDLQVCDPHGYLQDTINRLDLHKLIQCHDLALKNYRLATGHVSFNQHGLLEDFIIFWQQSNQAGRGT